MFLGQLISHLEKDKIKYIYHNIHNKKKLQVICQGTQANPSILVQKILIPNFQILTEIFITQYLIKAITEIYT